jgi:putative transposase
MYRLLGLFFGSLTRLLSSRRALLLENLALRQQLAVLKARRRQPRLSVPDKLFWVLARRLWRDWKHSLIIVTPETVVRWHRAGFRLYWTWLSRHRARIGRKQTTKELRALIFQMVAENPTWGAPRIHGELQMLGFDVSERTVSRWVRRAPKNPEPAKRWMTFLNNHRELIAGMDFFTVPTLTFGVLYCFFVIAHGRRRILQLNVTRNPTGRWVVQQLREAFPYDSARRYLIFDRDAKFSLDVVAAVRALGSTPTRTSFRSPWQNGVAERWVGSCRRDLLDHIIVRDERHLKRLLSEYVRYYHQDRTHLGLNKETPAGRAVAKGARACLIQCSARVGGLHHRYDRVA